MEIKGAGERILGAVMWFAIIIGIGMLIYIGIRYILGAPDERSKMKDGLTKWVIGALIIVFSSSIVLAVLGIVNVDSSTGTQSLANQIVHGLDN